MKKSAINTKRKVIEIPKRNSELLEFSNEQGTIQNGSGVLIRGVVIRYLLSVLA